MQFRSVLIHCFRRLGTAIAIGAAEIKRGDAMCARNTFEGGAAAHRLNCVIAHILIVVLLQGMTFGQ